MDNLCHTLIGAALAQAGLKERTALGTATLVVGANLPDIDVVSLAWSDVASLQFRRGWTHGIVALLVLPFVLTGVMIAWDRLVRRRGDRAPHASARPRQLLLLSAISIVSHPALDYLNNYGMRWLMPFRSTWFYGDTLFIVDPWLWLMLAGGVLLARRRGVSPVDPGRGVVDPSSPTRVAETATTSRGAVPAKGRIHSHVDEAVRPARIALALAAAYIVLMLASSLAAERVVADRVASAGFAPVKMMVSPVLANPFRRFVVFDAGEQYRFGTFDWLPRGTLTLHTYTVPKGISDPAASTAAATSVGRAFLHWARFPFFAVEREAGALTVYIGDARYTLDPRDSWAAVTVRLPSRP